MLQVSHSHSYSSAHEHDDHGYGEKSWHLGPMQGGYAHRSLSPGMAGMVEEGADAMPSQPGVLLPQDIKRDYRSVPPHYAPGRGVETLAIRSHDPLRIVVADNGDDDIRVHHRQRGLDIPLLPDPAGPPNALAAEDPVDYSQFGEADRGSWRGLGPVTPMTDR